MIERMGFGMEQHAVLEDQQLLEWRDEPLAQMSRIEVFDNVEVGEKGMEAQYKAVRKDILSTNADTPTIIGVMGPPGVGKGSVAMGFWRLLDGDEYLHSKAKEKGFSIDVVSMPFALYQQAAKLDRVRASHPLLRDNPLYTPGHYAGTSQLEWEDLEENVLNQKDGKTKKVVLFESASTTSFPIDSSLPLRVNGIDRGNSPLYRSLVDPQTAAHTFVYAIEGDHEVQGEALSFRAAKPSLQDAHSLFTGEVEYFYTNSDGEEINMKDVSPEEQLDAALFLQTCMAPPRAMEQGVLDLRMQMDKVNARSTKEYFNKLKQVLNTNRLTTIRSPHLKGGKSYDMDYLLNSLPARKYPELVPDSLKQGKKR